MICVAPLFANLNKISFEVTMKLLFICILPSKKYLLFAVSVFLQLIKGFFARKSRPIVSLNGLVDVLNFRQEIFSKWLNFGKMLETHS